LNISACRWSSFAGPWKPYKR